jgi:hypothetical protein
MQRKVMHVLADAQAGRGTEILHRGIGRCGRLLVR